MKHLKSSLSQGLPVYNYEDIWDISDEGRSIVQDLYPIDWPRATEADHDEITRENMRRNEENQKFWHNQMMDYVSNNFKNFKPSDKYRLRTIVKAK
jgi:hypothetical protein